MIRAGILSMFLVLWTVHAIAEPVHGIAMHGAPDLDAGFVSFPYVNPDAPKGGTIRYGRMGSFDSLNPFIVKGRAPGGLIDATMGKNVYESLLARNYSEAFSLYGLIAEKVEMPTDRTSITFFINRLAKFSDGTPITAADVQHSFDILKTYGRPNYRNAYGQVLSVELIDDLTIKFNLSGSDRELPLILGLMSILPKHAMSAETFQKTSLTPPIGSGPYLVDRIEAGSRITFKRNENYWGKDLPAKRGFDNFDQIDLLYFRDFNALFEGFRKGLFDVFEETDPARWSSVYDFPAVSDGRIERDEIATGTPKGMKALVFNTRKDKFSDIKMREAIGYLFDFEWINRSAFHGLYKRADSYFSGSILSSAGLAASAEELAILNDVDAKLETRFLDGSYRLPQSDASGRDRKPIRASLKLLKEAGYVQKDRKLVNSKTGEALEFEILVHNKTEERVALAFQRVLMRVGIDVSIRLVDSSQFWDRLKNFDYDMIPFHWRASLSPGNEQYFRWSQEAAKTPGTFNFAGAQSPVIDALIDRILAAKNKTDFHSAIRAYDRYLMSRFYVIPLYYSDAQWIARWAQIGRAKEQALNGWQPSGWWASGDKQDERKLDSD